MHSPLLGSETSALDERSTAESLCDNSKQPGLRERPLFFLSTPFFIVLGLSWFNFLQSKQPYRNLALALPAPVQGYAAGFTNAIWEGDLLILSALSLSFLFGFAACVAVWSKPGSTRARICRRVMGGAWLLAVLATLGVLLAVEFQAFIDWPAMQQSLCERALGNFTAGVSSTPVASNAMVALLMAGLSNPKSYCEGHKEDWEQHLFEAHIDPITCHTQQCSGSSVIGKSHENLTSVQEQDAFCHEAVAQFTLPADVASDEAGRRRLLAPKDPYIDLNEGQREKWYAKPLINRSIRRKRDQRKGYDKRNTNHKNYVKARRSYHLNQHASAELTDNVLARENALTANSHAAKSLGSRGFGEVRYGNSRRLLAPKDPYIDLNEGQREKWYAKPLINRSIRRKRDQRKGYDKRNTNHKNYVKARRSYHLNQHASAELTDNVLARENALTANSHAAKSLGSRGFGEVRYGNSRRLLADPYVDLDEGQRENWYATPFIDQSRHQEVKLTKKWDTAIAKRRKERKTRHSKYLEKKKDAIQTDNVLSRSPYMRKLDGRRLLDALPGGACAEAPEDHACHALTCMEPSALHTFAAAVGEAAVARRTAEAEEEAAAALAGLQTAYVARLLILPSLGLIAGVFVTSSIPPATVASVLLASICVTAGVYAVVPLPLVGTAGTWWLAGAGMFLHVCFAAYINRHINRHTQQAPQSCPDC